MLRWQLEKKNLDLKYTWKISRNASDTKTNLFVRVSDGSCEGMGEAAPNVRYNESPESLEKEFAAFAAAQLTPASLRGLEVALREMNLGNALRFAIESAYAHYLAKQSKATVYDTLAIEAPKDIFTAYTIPIMDIGAIKTFYEQNNLSRFAYIKVKVDHETGQETLQHINTFIRQPLIVDANESWKDVEQLIYFLEKIKKHRIVFVEQPLPASLNDEALYMKRYSPFPLFADESVTDTADFGLLKRMFDGVNVKLMKAGGYLNGIRLLKEAKANTMQTMIGCMVETTLGISSGMNLCSLANYVDLDSFLLLKEEPFRLVYEKEGQLLYR